MNQANQPDLPLRTGGIILAGGRSSRMGRSKAHLPFGDELMLPRVVRLLKTVVEPVVVIGAPDQDLPDLDADVAIGRDEIAERGPLQGLASGLSMLQGRCNAAYACSCDVPLLEPRFVRRMVELLGDGDIAVPHVDDYHHPLAAVYRLTVLPHVESLLASDRRRPVFLFDLVSTRIVSANELLPVDPDLRSLRNCNRPEDYGGALEDAGLRAP
ncbi:MAG: molybdopterin-guanine dinucleotide biosynthesis protein MobA [Phycisphaeraceae bacterium]|nr:molybdopterin-guanine dinucleotide biosynthesis protein MobA [Phycisphaeraceae bacterium]